LSQEQQTKKEDMNYIKPLIEFVSENKLRPGVVQHVQVMHDDSCLFLNGKGACNCNVEIKTMADPYKKGNRQQRRKQKKTRGKRA